MIDKTQSSVGRPARTVRPTLKLPRLGMALVLLLLPMALLIAAAVYFIRADAARTRELVWNSDRAEVENRLGRPLAAVVQAAKARAEGVLRGLPENLTTDQLITSIQNEECVRNMFLWVPKRGVVFPMVKGATREESRFLARYVTLFEEVLTKNAAPVVTNQVTGKAAPIVWRSWFEGAHLSFIGWRHFADGRIVGLELETVAFLSEFPTIFAASKFSDLVVSMRDDNAYDLFVTGSRPENLAPVGTLSLAPELPHRELVVWRVRPMAGLNLRYYLAIGVTILVFAVLFLGGVLLVSEARRERRASLQKTSFVSNVSHELKTPLTAIRLSAEMLSEGRVRETAARDRYLATIVRECERLTRLVNNILDFGRLEQNRRKFDWQSVRLADAVKEAAESQRARVEEAGFELVVSCVGDQTRLLDRDALSQVVVNLMDNAVKYAASGRYLAVTVSASGCVQVSDKGPGIAPRHRAHIFERFYRCDDSITATAGSGLGLSISRRLIEEMGGTLTFAPRVGGGATFTIQFGETV